MARILVGTCSWTDPTLLATDFYPKEANTPERRLQYYASNFPIVEVDSTYYSMLAQRTAALWCERTPRHFTFDIKAFSLLTHHPTQLRSLPKDVRSLLPKGIEEKRNLYYRDVPGEARAQVWQMFADALLPLDSAGKLGVVLFQFPQWFLPGRESKEHILHCQESLPQYRLAIEFRNASWLSGQRGEDSLRFLRGNNLIFVCVDEPQGFRSSLPPVAEATSDMAVVRFHGRNRETWEKRGITAAERFDYLYNREELREWAPKIERLASQAREVHVLFNNCRHDYGVRNARDMVGLLPSFEPTQI